MHTKDPLSFFSLFRHPGKSPSRRITTLCLKHRRLFAAVLLCFSNGAAHGMQQQENSTSSVAAPASQLVSQRQPREQITVLFQGKEVAVHHSGKALDKSYIHPLWTPDGRIITYDAPADHVHHRGLCVGWPDVSGVDFWAEVWAPKGRRGKILTQKLQTETLPDGPLLIREQNDWQKEDGVTLVREERIWTFLPPRGNLQLVDVDIILTAVVSEVVFGSDTGTPREYHGLTLRMGPFDQPRFFNSRGDVGDQECHSKPAKWCALSGIQSGRPVTAAILDHPSNDCHPTRFFVLGRGMQFISSSPNFGAPKVLKSGESWRLKYRVIAAGAPPQAEEWDIESLWKEFAR
jgi:hypothetical protein